MSRMSTRRCLLLAVSIAALASCDALVGISGTHVSNGGAGGSAGAGGKDASAGSDATVDAIADSSADHSVGPLPSHGLGCALWPGNKVVTVGCPSGQVITGFSTVLYGNPTGSCSGGDAGADGGNGFQPGSCNVDGAKAALEALCDDLPSCTFKADSNLQAFTGDAGDPCPGTSKVIAVQVECGPAPDIEAGSEAGAPVLPVQGQILDFDATGFKNNTIGDPLPGGVWNDSSPNHDNATVPTGTGVASPTVGLDQNTGNGLVRFSGKNEYLKLKGPLPQALSNGLTAFAVVAPLNNKNDYQAIFDFANPPSSGSPSPPDSILLTETPTLQGMQFQVNVGQTKSGFTAPGVANTNQLELFSVRAQPAPSVGSSLQAVTMYKGGAPIYEQFVPSPTDVTRTLNRIGMHALDGATPFDGYMAQLLVYNRALSDAEMNGAHEALMSSWSLCTATNTQTDPANCGHCGHLCAPGQTCQGGVCEGSMFAKCDMLDVGDQNHYDVLCHPGSSQISWVQARNACEELGGDLISVSTQAASNTVAGAASEPALVGLTDFGTSSFEWSDGNPATFAAWGGDAGVPSTTTESCASVVSGSDWEPVSCTKPLNLPWICSLPPLHGGKCRKFLEPTSNRTWDICEGQPENDLLRRAVCESEGGHLLGVQDETEASLLGQLLVRYSGDLPESAIDLTDGVMPFHWTLESGKSAPFLGWASGEPSVGLEPRCAFLRSNGKIAATRCNDNPYPVICSLPNGTPPDQNTGPPPLDVVFSYDYGIATADVALQLPGGGSSATGIQPGASIPATIVSQCSEDLTMSYQIGVSPGTWQTCIKTACNAQPKVNIQAPSVAGTFDVYVDLSEDTKCNAPVGPRVFGRIAVAPP